MKNRLSIGVALAATLTRAGSQLAAIPSADDIRQQLEPIRAQYHLPAIAGAIVTSKGLEAVAVIGVRKAGADVAVTDDDQWHLGSDTKAMTAVVIARLVEENKLHWASTIADVFPELAPTFSADFRKITLEELLCHRSGLPLTVDLQNKNGSIHQRRIGALITAASIPLLSKPGTAFCYSNLGYIIAEPWPRK